MAGETESPKPKRTRKFTIARRITVLIPVALLVVGLAFNTGTGTLSSFGWRDIAAICPLGVLETMIATATAIPRWIIVLALFVIFVLLFGRAFCAWLCPVPPISSLGKGLDKKRTPDEVANPPRRRKVDSRHAVLLGALLSTGIFGYPVFCLVCPVGLTFATIICLWRAFQFAEPTWGLLVFPLIIVVEVVVFAEEAGVSPPAVVLSVTSPAVVPPALPLVVLLPASSVISSFQPLSF